MKKILFIFIIALIIAIGSGLYIKKNIYHSSQSTTNALSISDIQTYIEKTLNFKADFFKEEGVVKINIPRSEIPFEINKHSLDPFMGTTTWIGIQKGLKPGVEAMIMGDLVLLQHEVNHVMSAALESNIQITALHNHFFFEDPRIFFMHIEFEGSLVETVQGIQNIIEAYHTAPKNLEYPTLSRTNNISKAPLEKIITVNGTDKDGMVKFVIGRQTHASCGCPVGKNMGINSWAAFAGTNDKAIVVGDLALFQEELHNVLKVFRKHNFNVVAVHNHMIYEQPRVMFVHYLAYGPATTLAHGVKKALDQTSSLTK